MNLLVALAWPSHVHHAQGHRWFAGKGARGWATCPLTQCGFVRVSSNPTAIPEAVSPRDAWALLKRMTAIGRHHFWPDDLDLCRSGHYPSERVVGHGQVTDAYLLGLALRRRAKLATLDRKIAALLPSQAKTGSSLEFVLPRA